MPDRLVITIANSFSRSGPAQWRGRLYNTLDGVTYNGTLNLINKNTITLVGCVLEGLFCEAKALYRANARLPRGVRIKTDDSTTGKRIAVAPPPLPKRKAAQTRRSSLRKLFNTFLDLQLAGTSQTITAKERDELFKGFLVWWERQPAENLDKINDRLRQ